ncbi:hypothetical protein BGZ61DRAFT_446376 [Ilyonectria robusta]|uniref:uncharacterized protein n=1 Tax=Ilyonectria robusta TaxID=1079257 RepID=UPI001E8CC0FB|nr:uncharacterized protein BGZ61DRAFT_446376 [Ilyonectria robusta]KAH8729426.1 hypothetical protein BGZ61DRAFT_446376 [Ilyonectria robusta]
MRRKHEPRGIIRYMTERTTEQPNYRRFRSLRNLQGLDYIHMLRGMELVTFLDYDLWIERRTKTPVRDFTFVMDVNNAVRRPKAAEDLRLSRFGYLAPLLDHYRACETDRIAVGRAIERRGAFGAPPSPRPDHRNAIHQPPTIVVDSSDSEDDDENSDSESDGSDDGNSPSPGSGGGDGGGDGEDEGDDDDGSDGGDGGGDGEDESDDDDGSDGGDGGGAAELDINFDFAAMEGRFPRASDRGSPASERTIIDLTSDGEESFSESDAMTARASPDAPGHFSRPVDSINSGESGMTDSPQTAPNDNPNQDEQQVLQPGEEPSLFVLSPSTQEQLEFIAKVESPDPRQGSTPAVAGNSMPPPARRSGSRNVTPASRQFTTPGRQLRAESDLFVSGTPYNDIVRSSSARGSRHTTRAPTAGMEGEPQVIDLTGPTGGLRRSRDELDGFISPDGSVSRRGGTGSEGSSPKRARFV